MPSLLWRRVGVAAFAALALASICAHAQTVATSREDAGATERGFSSERDVDDSVEEELVATTVCTRCANLGDVALFDAPLYGDCDAILLNSLVNEGFEYDIKSQAGILFADLANAASPANPGVAPSADTFEIEGSPFIVEFSPVPTIPFNSGNQGAPTFAGKFVGRSENPVGVPFELPFLCTLNPSVTNLFAEADCTSDLTILENAGIVPKIPRGFDPITMQPTGFFPPALLNFSLVLKRDSICKSRDLIFVGSNVERASTAQGNPMNMVTPVGVGVMAATSQITDLLPGSINIPDFVLDPGEFTIVQQILLKGTKTFR